MEVIYVNTSNTLQDVCARLGQAATIGVDTEFLREKTYYAQLCLIQICGNGLIAFIDPIELDNIDAALDIIYDPSIAKIIHSGRQDLEVFFDIKKSLPDNIYDTQLAATYLGYGEQIGYATLVEEILGVSLAKTETRTDWSRRPLNERQLAYAADDVRYLHALYEFQVEKLRGQQRLDWVNDDMHNLTDISLFDKPKQLLWQRVKAWQQLHGQELAILQDLAIMREEHAIKRNRPRRWILSDDILVSLAKIQPEADSQLRQVVADKIADKYAQDIFETIDNAKKNPPVQWPQVKGRHDFSSSETKLIKQIMELVRKRAAENDLTAPLIASRKDIESLVSGHPQQKLQRGWRYDIVGKELLALLNNEASKATREQATVQSSEQSLPSDSDHSNTVINPGSSNKTAQ